MGIICSLGVVHSRVLRVRLRSVNIEGHARSLLEAINATYATHAPLFEETKSRLKFTNMTSVLLDRL